MAPITSRFVQLVISIISFNSNNFYLTLSNYQRNKVRSSNYRIFKFMIEHDLFLVLNMCTLGVINVDSEIRGLERFQGAAPLVVVSLTGHDTG